MYKSEWVKVRWNTNRIDLHERISESKELVDTGDNDGPNDADNPSAQSKYRHCRIVCVGHRGPDFRIRRLIFQYNGCWVDVGVIIGGNTL